ncbi:unnamed protein product [Rotaria magnacalcarata]|uniref:N-acetyltransferase domain-containing protein n=1 Tax=Rotaria magnacalcarata TaxID=392030 RepID=A0A816N9C4_9BILA|nr:unnamed protein product [Rotaria magnacalcarata]
MGDIAFAPLNESHLSLLLYWLETPHVKLWWDQDIKWTAELIQDKYAHYINGYKKFTIKEKTIEKPIHAFIILFKKMPIGYIQYYNKRDFPPEQEYDISELPASCAGLDWYIGEVEFTAKGIGTKALGTFLKEHVFSLFNHVLVDPDTTNTKAIHVYKKAGFTVIKKTKIGNFSDGELRVEVQDNIEENVIIVQSMSHPVNDHLMELLLLVDTVKRDGAKNITALIPYFGYSRQDRCTYKYGPISASLVIKILEAAGVTKVVTLDLHSKQLEGVFNVPIINLDPANTFIPNMTKEVKKIIISITGASGAIYGIRLLEILKEYDLETHLIISKSANLSIATETSLSINEIKNLADYVYNPSDIGAKISSGSFKVMGMIIAPCSMKTLSAIASGFENDLTIRAAGVMIKEQKKLALMTRETPLSPIHLENMLKLSRIGVAICPPVPAFYNKPTTLDDIVNHSITRVLDLFDIETNLIKRWQGV